MNRSLGFKALLSTLGILALVAGFAASTVVQASAPAVQSGPIKRAVSEFPKYAETEFERSVIRIPVQFGGDKKPREVVELTAFMKLEREPAVRNTIGYRQFEFTIREWELFGYSEALGGHVSFAASKGVVQPKSLCVSLQKDADFPALIVYNAIYDVFIDGKKVLSQHPGVAMARGVMEIPPRNITVAFQKPFAITRKLSSPSGPPQGITMMAGASCDDTPDTPECQCHFDPNCTIFLPGTCEDMSTIAGEEFESGLREARAIRAQMATLKPKPAAGAMAPGGHR